MTVSRVLQIEELAENQVQAYIVFNTALAHLENSFNSEIAIPAPTSPYFDSNPDLRRFMAIKYTDLTEDTDVFLPTSYADTETNLTILIEKFGIFRNDSDTYTITFKLTNDDGATQIAGTNTIELGPKELVLYKQAGEGLVEIVKVDDVQFWDKKNYDPAETGIFKATSLNDYRVFYRVMDNATQDSQYLVNKQFLNKDNVATPQAGFFVVENTSDTYKITVEVATDLDTDNTVDPASNPIIVSPKSAKLIYQYGTSLQTIVDLNEEIFLDFNKTFDSAATSKKITQIATNDIVFVDDFIGSFAYIDSNPTNAVAIDIKQNGTAIGSIAISTASAFTYTLTTTPTTITKGDVITFEETTTELADKELLVKLRGHK